MDEKDKKEIQKMIDAAIRLFSASKLSSKSSIIVDTPTDQNQVVPLKYVLALVGGSVTSFNGRTGAVILLSADVTGALGFTPYNSTNPSGYISTISGIAAGGDLTGTYANPTLKANLKLNSFGVTIDGQGGVLTTGSKGYVIIPFACTIQGWTILADQSGSCVIDVKRSTYSGFPSTSSIAGSDKPTLSSAQKNTDSSLISWGSTAIAAGDIIEWNVDSATTVTRVVLQLQITLT